MADFTSKHKKYSPEEIAQKVEEYFGRLPQKIKDEDGTFVGEWNMRPPTISGLRRHLGLASSERWKFYREDPVYKDILDDAVLRVEEWHESRLSGGSCQGSIFYLKNKSDWRDTVQVQSQSTLQVAQALSAEDEETYKKNMEAFFGSKSE